MPVALAFAAWAVSLLPVIAGASVNVIAAVWGGLIAGALLSNVPRGAQAMLMVFVGTVCFPMVDYLMPPPHDFVGGAPGSLAYFPADVFLIAAGVLAGGRGMLRFPTGPLRSLLIVGAVVAVAGIGGVVGSARPMESLMQWWVLVRGMSAAVVVWSLAASGRSVVPVLLAGGIIQGVLAAAHHFHRGGLGLALLGEAPADQLFKYISPGVGLWRSGGTMGHPNALASYAVGVLPVALAVGLSRGSVPRRTLGWIAAAATGAALLWTYSRSAWAVAVVTVTFVAACAGVHRRMRSLRGAVAASLAVLIAAAALPGVVHRLQRTESSATDVRVALASAAMAMVSAYPLSGVGLAQFPQRVVEFDPEMKLESFHHPVHNIVLLDTAEAGIPGGLASLLLWGGGLVVAWVRAWHAARRQTPESLGLWMGCAAIILHNGVDWTLRQPAIMLLFWILAALGSCSRVEDLCAPAPSVRRTPPQ